MSKTDEQDAKREELVQCIGMLHEKLVTNVDAGEEMSCDDTSFTDNASEYCSIVKELVSAIKKLKLLDATPCATIQPSVGGRYTPYVDRTCSNNADYRAGFRVALHKYAWWKDGVQYVGCGVTTLKQALDVINNVKGDDV